MKIKEISLKEFQCTFIEYEFDNLIRFLNTHPDKAALLMSQEIFNTAFPPQEAKLEP